MQNEMLILRSVLKVMFTKYRTCATKRPRPDLELPRPWAGFSPIVELEPYMLKAYLKQELPAFNLTNFKNDRVSDMQIQEIINVKGV